MLKGKLAWLIFIFATLACIGWIALGVQDEQHENGIFHKIIDNRLKLAESKEGPLNIGAAGDWTHYKGILKGIEHAAEDINRKGGILGKKVKLDIINDHGTEEGALSAAQRLCEKPEISFVIGHTNLKTNKAVAQNYGFYGVLTISPNIAAGLEDKTFTLFFENGMSHCRLGEAILTLAAKNGWKRLGLVYSKDENKSRQSSKFESMVDRGGINMPLVFAYKKQDPELPNHMERWKRELNLDALILAVEKQDIPPLLISIRDTGLNFPVIVPEEKTDCVTPGVPASCGATYYIADRYKNNGIAGNAEFCSGYDSLAILAQAIEKCGSFVPQDVAESMKEIKIKNSLSGTLSFSKHGVAVKRRPEFEKLN